jgi:hypothetical protein
MASQDGLAPQSLLVTGFIFLREIIAVDFKTHKKVKLSL